MPSPFPGMDPYLEPHWPDVHGYLVQASKSVLNRQMPTDLIARSEERVTIGSTGAAVRRLAPDVRVFEVVKATPAGNGHGSAGAEAADGNGGAEGGGSEGGGGVALAPYRLELLVGRSVQRFIEIRDASDGGRLVTVVEFLSPSNKVGAGREEFARKREELLAGGANVVEIDLVRAGDWELLLRPFVPPSAGRTAYRAVMFLPGSERLRWPTAFFHPMPLREALPSIRIPLRPDDRPAEVSLQSLVDDAYENGRYGLSMRYDRPPDPPLDADDAAWAAGRVAEWRASL